MKTFAVFFIFIFLSVTLPYTAQRENLKVKISARGDTITLKFFQPYVDTKLEGYILGYGSSMFSRQFIQLPEGGEPYETEIDAEPKYLIAVQPAKSNEVKKKCTGKVDLAKPLNLVIGSVTNSSVMLSWGTILKTPYTETYVEDCLEEDGQYTVRYREDEKEKEREKEKSPKWNYQSCPTTHTVIDNLKPDTDYEFGVRADTRDASGEWSPPVTHNTAEKVTEKPLSPRNQLKPVRPIMTAPRVHVPPKLVRRNRTQDRALPTLRNTSPPRLEKTTLGPGVDVRALSSVEAPPTSAQPLPSNLPSTTLPVPMTTTQHLLTTQYQPTTTLHRLSISQYQPGTSQRQTNIQYQPKTIQHQPTTQYYPSTSQHHLSRTHYGPTKEHLPISPDQFTGHPQPTALHHVTIQHPLSTTENHPDTTPHESKIHHQPIIQHPDTTKQKTTDQHQISVNKYQPRRPQHHPATTQHQPTANKHHLVTTQDQPSTTKHQFITQYQPRTTQYNPTSNHQFRTTKPKPRRRQPQPSIPRHKSNIIKNHQNTTKHQQSIPRNRTTTQPKSKTPYHHSTTQHQPTTTKPRRPKHKTSTIQHQPSAVQYPLSTTEHQPGTVQHQTTTQQRSINQQQSTPHQPSIIQHQSTTQQPSIIQYQSTPQQPKIQNQPSTSQYQPTTQHQIITSRQQPKIQHWPSTSHLHTSEQQPTTQHQLTAQYHSTTQPQTTTQNQPNAIKTTSGLQKHTNKPPLSSNKPKVYTSKGLLSRKTSTHQQNTSKHHLIATQNQYSTIPPQKQPRTIKNQPPKENHTHSYTKLQTITIPWSPSSTTFNSPGEPQPTLPLPPAEKHSPSPIRKQPLNAIQTSHSTAPPITTLYQPGAAKHPVTDIQEPVSQSGRVIWNNSSISMPFSQVTTAVQKVGPRHQPAPLSAVNQIKPHPFRKNTFQGKTRGGNGERHKGLLQSKKVQGSGSAPPSVKKSNLVGKFKEKEKVIDLKKEDPIPVPKLYTSTTTKTPANKDVPRTTTLFHLFNDSNFDTGDNSSVFSHVPSSKVDNKGKERFTAPHVIYKTDKHPDEPCSITHSLSFFPEEEVSDINVTAPPRNPPSNLTVVTVEGCPSFIILDWEKADNETTEYEVTTSTKGPHGDEVSVLTTNQTHTAVENLKPESSYEFKVTPKNELGSGPTSQPVTFSTESADPRVSDHRTSKNAIWSSYSFKTESYSECSGRQYVKRTWYRKFVGIQLCNSLRYKIYLSDSLNGKFYDIGDLAGNGEDHCQFVDSFLDGRTGSQLPQDQLPRKKGYYRAMRQEPVSFGDIGGGTHINYASWYECGTSIPGKW